MVNENLIVILTVRFFEEEKDESERGRGAGLIAIGLGCAPIYPSLLHETPDNFGPELSQAIMGIQMACAYVGSTFMPPIFGLIAEYVSIKFYPLYLLLFVIIMVIMVEKLNRVSKS